MFLIRLYALLTATSTRTYWLFSAALKQSMARVISCSTDGIEATLLRCLQPALMLRTRTNPPTMPHSTRSLLTCLLSVLTPGYQQVVVRTCGRYLHG